MVTFVKVIRSKRKKPKRHPFPGQLQPRHCHGRIHHTTRHRTNSAATSHDAKTLYQAEEDVLPMVFLVQQFTHQQSARDVWMPPWNWSIFFANKKKKVMYKTHLILSLIGIYLTWQFWYRESLLTGISLSYAMACLAKMFAQFRNKMIPTKKGGTVDGWNPAPVDR